MKTFAVLILVLSSTLNLRAHPVFYADGWGLMFWQKPDSTEFYGAYTLSHRWAVGVRYFGFSDPKTKDLPQENYALLQSSFLLKRWNKPASQANIYLSVAGGAANFSSPSYFASRTQGAYLGELQADWEDRKYYTAIKLQHLQAQDHSAQQKIVSRLGFAPYVAEYTELNTWIIFEGINTLSPESSFDLTPFVRLFYNNFLMELGYSFGGKFQMNLMTHL
jgi:hypothetical protein